VALFPLLALTTAHWPDAGEVIAPATLGDLLLWAGTDATLRVVVDNGVAAGADGGSFVLTVASAKRGVIISRQGTLTVDGDTVLVDFDLGQADTIEALPGLYSAQVLGSIVGVREPLTLVATLEVKAPVGGLDAPTDGYDQPTTIPTTGLRIKWGAATFAGENQVDVEFDTPFPDGNYRVTFGGVDGNVAWVIPGSKVGAGFTVGVGSDMTGDIDWTALYGSRS